MRDQGSIEKERTKVRKKNTKKDLAQDPDRDPEKEVKGLRRGPEDMTDQIDQIDPKGKKIKNKF